MRNSNLEIVKAKMLGRTLSLVPKNSAPPLSLAQRARFRWHHFKKVVRNAYWKMYGLSECPHCNGRGTGYTIYRGKNEPCVLCNGAGNVGPEQRKTLRYARALFEYRTKKRQSIHGLAADLCVSAAWLGRHESGLVSLDQWPKNMLRCAEEML